jgi:capsular polysaccharide biosynthesis protein
MELNEVVRRIFGQHWRLILCFIALGIAAPALLHLGDAPTYTASARAVLDTQDPVSRAESAAIVDTARAIATSPTLVRDALSAAHVTGRDPVEVADHHVSVRGLGSSGVFQLSVSDREPRTAAAIANALAAQLIRVRLDATQGQTRRVLADLGQEIDNLDAKITYLDARIDSLNERLSGASGLESAGALRAERARAIQLSDSLIRQRGTLEVQQSSVLSSESVRPKATIISRAGPPTAADSSRFLADVVLGALLGLVLGVGVAGIIETFRPTLVGGDALAREFRAPLLGTLTNEPDESGALQDEGIGMRLRLAAEAASLLKVSLVPIGPQVNVGPLAEWLEAASSEDVPELVVAEPELAESVGAVPGRPWRVAIGAHAGAPAHPAVRVRPFDVQNASASLNNGTPGGLVFVLPTTVKKGELMDAGHLLTVSRLPLLGLITYPCRRRPVDRAPRE